MATVYYNKEQKSKEYSEKRNRIRIFFWLNRQQEKLVIDPHFELCLGNDVVNVFLVINNSI